MPAMTTVERVGQILETTLPAGTVQAFVDDASLWVTEELATAGLSVARMELITRYLAAALVRVRDLGVTQVSFDDVREVYQMDPQVTDYLLRASSMDPTGKVRDSFVADQTNRTRGFFRMGEPFRRRGSA